MNAVLCKNIANALFQTYHETGILSLSTTTSLPADVLRLPCPQLGSHGPAGLLSGANHLTIAPSNSIVHNGSTWYQ